MLYKKDTISIFIALYIILAMVSPSTGNILTKIGRVILMLGFLLTSRLRIRIPRESKKYILWALAFFFYCLIGCFFAFSKSYATSYVITLAYVIVCDIVLAIVLIKKKSYIDDVLHYIVYGATLKAIICYVSNGFFCFLNSRATDNMSANTIGFYCAFAAIICWFLSRENRKATYKFLFLANVLFMLLSASRKAILFLIIPLAVMVITKSKNPLTLLRNILLVVVAILLFFLALIKVDFLYTLIGSRLVGMINGLLGIGVVDASTDTRLGLISDGMSWFKENPIWGYGLSNFKALCEVYRPWGSVFYAHNNYVELLVDCGLVGTCIYYSLLVCLLVKGIVSWRRLDPQQLMLLGMLIAILICDYGMVTYFDLFSQLMLLLAYSSLNYLNCTEQCLDSNDINWGGVIPFPIHDTVIIPNYLTRINLIFDIKNDYLHECYKVGNPFSNLIIDRHGTADFEFCF